MDTGKVIALTRRMIKKELSDLGPYHYVGTVADVDELPLSANVGDVYNVGVSLDSGNYVWNGTGWDSIGDKYTAYEPLLRFSSTPVYDVTLAEDITTDSNNPIVLFDNEKAGMVKFGMLMPAASSAGGTTFKITLNTNETIEITNGSSFSTSGRNTFVDFSVTAGMLNVTTGNSSGTSTAWDKYERFFYPRYFGSYIKKFYFYATTGIAIPTGTQISCYVATPAVNTQDGILNIGLAFESDVRALL